jgi:hypothetical protein
LEEYITPIRIEEYVKQETSMKQTPHSDCWLPLTHLFGLPFAASAHCLLHADFLLCLLFNPKDGGDMFL